MMMMMMSEKLKKRYLSLGGRADEDVGESAERVGGGRRSGGVRASCGASDKVTHRHGN